MNNTGPGRKSSDENIQRWTYSARWRSCLRYSRTSLNFVRFSGVGFHQGLVRLEHRLGLPGVVLRGGGAVSAAARGRFAAFDRTHIDGEKLVEPEIAEQVVVALVQIDHMEMSLAEFAQTNAIPASVPMKVESITGTIPQIHHKLAMAAVDHFLGEILYSRDCSGTTLFLDPHPTRRPRRHKTT